MHSRSMLSYIMVVIVSDVDRDANVLLWRITFDDLVHLRRLSNEEHARIAPVTCLVPNNGHPLSVESLHELLGELHIRELFPPYLTLAHVQKREISIQRSNLGVQ